MNMKLKTITMLLLAMGMLASCDKDDVKGDYTEVWTVNIEPEFVLSGDFCRTKRRSTRTLVKSEK